MKNVNCMAALDADQLDLVVGGYRMAWVKVYDSVETSADGTRIGMHAVYEWRQIET